MTLSGKSRCGEFNGARLRRLSRSIRRKMRSGQTIVLETNNYVAILRCQTWHVWPEKFVADHAFALRLGTGTAPARVAVLSYAQRTASERYVHERTDRGPLLWDGETRGLLRIGDAVLKAPEDTIEITNEHRHAERGEVDICIGFPWIGELPAEALESLRATAFAVAALLNVQVGDHLTPTMPLQVRKVQLEGGGEFSSGVVVAVKRREVLEREALQVAVADATSLLLKSSFGDRLVAALELYTAQFSERQARVRFLLLVIAIEVLANPTLKHAVVLSLLGQWYQQLQIELERFDPSSEEFQSLQALAREMLVRKDDSIRSRVRKLFANLPGVTPIEGEELARKALRVYDKRSTLVHDGRLPAHELTELVEQARTLVEKIFMAAVHQQRASAADRPL